MKNSDPSDLREAKWNRSVERYKKWIDEWDGRTTSYSFVIGNTPNALLQAGLPDKQIRYHSTKVSSEVLKHLGMGKEEMKVIPDILHDPILVIGSKEYLSRRVVMGDQTDAFGHTIVIVIETNPRSRSGRQIPNLLRIASSQGRSHIASLIRGARIYYVEPDMKKVQKWLNLNRVRFPLGSSILNYSSFIPSNPNSVK